MAFDNPGERGPLSTAEKKKRLLMVGNAYSTLTGTFRAIPGLEYMDNMARRAISTLGTNLQPAVNALNAAGIETPSNIGGLMDNLGIDADEIHTVACACHGDKLEAGYFGDGFKYLASKIPD